MITIKNIQKKYQNLIIVNNVTIHIKSGELFFILGPSGCGKTTLLKIIAGLVIPEKGDILLNNINLSKLESNKRNINLMFQNYALFPHLTVYDNIAFGLMCRKVNSMLINTKVEKVMNLFHIEELKDRIPKSLSGGEQQRVALARAIVNEPELLLLDEPLGALDEKLKKVMQTEIMSLQKKLRLTCVYVTHDQVEALSMADRIAIMDKGMIVQIGTPNEVYYNPKNKFVADFIGEINFIKYRQKKSIGKKITFLLQEGIELKAKCNEDLTESILAIRPEHISLQLDSNDSLISGKIINKEFRGTYTQYTVQSNIDKIFRINLQNIDIGKQFEIKTKVFLSWDKDNLIEIEK